MVWLADGETKRTLPCAVWPVTSRISAVSPTLDAGSLRSDTSTTASIGSSATIWPISLPMNENAAPPTSLVSR